MPLENLDICLLCLTFLCGSIFTQSDVRRPPAITSNPETCVTFVENQRVTLTCKAHGTPAVTYSWRMNGVALHLNDSNVKRGSDGDITISPTIRTSDGFYQCFATNKYGTAISKYVYMRGAFLNRSSHGDIVNVTVQEGRPFVIQSAGRYSYPTIVHNWHVVTSSAVNSSVTAFHESQRVIQASNGDLYGAYALTLDEDIYRSTVYNGHAPPGVLKTHTRLIVSQGSHPPPDFPPNLTYFSKSQEVALVGGSIELRCIFSGKPPPEITWSRPKKNLPSGRCKIANYNTLLSISDIRESDEGEYVCSATNNVTNETASYTHNIRVGTVPKFKQESDRPRDVNVTEGDSITLNCSAYAKPEPIVVWLQNGEPIDVKNPPTRFVFGNNNKSLTIRDVCRDCVDKERKTDLMVIQCKASNPCGYEFAQGYLNVLLRTKVTIRGTRRNVSVDFLEAKEFVYQCNVTSDPSTPATMKWRKTKPYNDLVRDEPPYIFVRKEFLIIMIYPNCTSECSKYLEEYRCVGDSEYSSGHAAMTIYHRHQMPSDPVPQKEELWAEWKVIVGCGTIGLVLFLIGMFLGCRSKRRRPSGTVNRRAINRRLPNLPSMYERVDSDSVGIPLVARENRNGSMRRALSMYDRIGYASIDQVLNDMANTSDANDYSGYDSIDANHGEANDIGRQLQDDVARYDDMGYSIPLEAGQNRVEADHYQVHGVNFESSHSRNFLVSNHQSGSNGIYSDLSRRDINPYLDLENSNQSPPEINRYLDLVFSNQSPREIDPYLDLGISNQSPSEINPYLDLGISNQSPPEINPYLGLVISNQSPPEINPYLDLGISNQSPPEINPYLDLGISNQSPPENIPIWI